MIRSGISYKEVTEFYSPDDSDKQLIYYQRAEELPEGDQQVVRVQKKRKVQSAFIGEVVTEHPTIYFNTQTGEWGESMDPEFFNNPDCHGDGPIKVRQVGSSVTSFFGNISMNGVSWHDDCFTDEGMVKDDLFIYCAGIKTVFRVFRGDKRVKKVSRGLFRNCPNLWSFTDLFYNCSNLEELPDDLFLYSPKVREMQSLCKGCVRLKYIPGKLFDPCDPSQIRNLSETFRYCEGLTGPAPELWEMFPKVNERACFEGCKGLSNYGEMPSSWKMYY